MGFWDKMLATPPRRSTEGEREAEFAAAIQRALAAEGYDVGKGTALNVAKAAIEADAEFVLRNTW